MAKLTPSKTFLLKVEGEPGSRKRIIARKGEKIDVTDREHQQFAGNFVEPYVPKKK